MLDAALALAAREGWRRASLGAIAAEADVSLGEAYALFRSRAAILTGLIARIDARILARSGRPDPDETPRDRLFEILMRRFDALKAERAALSSIARDLLGDPATALCTGPAVLRSMAWMLEGAGISSAGLIGRVRTKLLAAVYLAALRAFLADDSRDLAKTMAALDRGLDRAGPWLGLGGAKSGETASG